MFLKKYYNLFIIIALSFFNTHIIQASLTDGVITLPKQCHECVKLKFEAQELKTKNLELTACNLYFYKLFEGVATVMNSSKEPTVKDIEVKDIKVKDIIAKLQENKRWQAIALSWVKEKAELTEANKALQASNTQLNTSINELTLENNALKTTVQQKNEYLEIRNNQNMSLHRTVFYYKCAFSISLLLLVMSLIYPKIINNK